MDPPPIVGFYLEKNKLSGSIPEGLAGMVQARNLRFFRNKLSGSIPAAVAGMQQLISFVISSNQLSGSFVPEALASVSSMDNLEAHKNRLDGAIPAAVASLASLLHLAGSGNCVAGSVPDAVHKLSRITGLEIADNRLTGLFPKAVLSGRYLAFMKAHGNGLSHSFPSFLISLPKLVGMNLNYNHFTGSLSEAEASAGTTTMIRRVLDLKAAHNSITGALPSGMPTVASKLRLDLSCNLLKGTLPLAATLHMAPYIEVLLLTDNMIAGSIPQGCSKLVMCDVGNNMLTGSVPNDFNPDLAVLRCSGNALEGTLPQWLKASKLQLLGVAGLLGSPKHLKGPLPSTLARALKLKMLLAQDQSFEDSIPGLASTLIMLAAHRNSLRVLPDLQFFNESIILVHQNALSCNLPRFGTVIANLSLAAFGNKFWHPSADFPGWIVPVERDGQFWVSRWGGLLLACKFGSAVILFSRLVIWKAGLQACSAISRWRVAGGMHSLLADGCIHHVSCMTLAALLSMSTMPPLLSRTRYRCPGGLDLASACLKENTLVGIIVALCWARFCFSIGLQRWAEPSSLTSGHKATRWSRGSITKRCFQCSCCVLLALALSALSALDQAGKAVPGFLLVRGWALFVISMSIGGVQSVLIKAVVPCLTRFSSPDMLFLAGIINLCVTCIVPALVIIYLDSACLGYWTAHWEACSKKKAGQFQRSVWCPVGPLHEWCPTPSLILLDAEISILRTDDICRGQQHASAATCVQVVLLRLQDFWISKWISAGLVFPALTFRRKGRGKEAASVVRQLALTVEVAAIASGALPLLTPVLLVGTLSEVLLTAMSWEEGTLKIAPWTGSMDIESLSIGQILSVILHCAFTSKDRPASLIVLLAAIPLVRRPAVLLYQKWG